MGSSRSAFHNRGETFLEFRLKKKKVRFFPSYILGRITGPADGEAEVVLPRTGAGVAAGAVIGKRIPGVERLVRPIVTRRPVKLVGASARREVEQAAAHIAELGRKDRRLQGELLDGLHGGLKLIGNVGVEASRAVLAFGDDLVAP